ncbi:MAG: sensor domain-containing protein [Actinomycetota bacterium]
MGDWAHERIPATTIDRQPPVNAYEMWQSVTAGFRDARTWRGMLFVVVSFFVHLALFVFALALLAVSVPLVAIGVGIPLTVWSHAAIDRFVGFERGRARRLGHDVTAPPAPSGSMWERFRSGSRWRTAGLALTIWFPTLLLFVLLVVVWAIPLFALSVPIWGWALDTPWIRLALTALIGAALLPLAPWASLGIGRLVAQLIGFVGSRSRLVAAEAEVAEVSQNRDEILTAVTSERRRIERNLHDGVQQQLVALGIDLGLAEAKMATDPEAAATLLADARRKARESIGELRVIGRGLHPAILGDRGLDAALSAAVASSTVPVELRTDLEVQPPLDVQEAAYFVVSEALTNVMKHADANLAVVDVTTSEGHLHVSIYDDGKGGATLAGTGAGGGLSGIGARVRGLGGTFDLNSPKGGPTTIAVAIPLEGRS